jgi:hypothetical protein
MKKHFETQDSEFCHPKQVLLANGVTVAFEAKPVKGTGFFFCNEFQQVGEVGNCGRDCLMYNPRNGKNGICKHYRGVYEPDKKVELK